MKHGAAGEWLADACRVRHPRWVGVVSFREGGVGLVLLRDSSVIHPWLKYRSG